MLIIVIDHWRHLLEIGFTAIVPEAIGIELLVSSSRICRIGLLRHSANDIISRFIVIGSIIDATIGKVPSIRSSWSLLLLLFIISIIKYNLSRSSLLI